MPDEVHTQETTHLTIPGQRKKARHKSLLTFDAFTFDLNLLFTKMAVGPWTLDLGPWTT
jgi:hypothetical protein